jgi:hypothetical protein
MINSLKDIPNGAVLFKSTDMKDKDKPLSMRIINAFTDLFQSIAKKKLIRGDDHSEFLCRNLGILETHSSVYPQGVRTQNFEYWIEREGFPFIEILAPPVVMSFSEIRKFKKKITSMRGLEYNLDRAMKSLIGKEFELGIENGVFCSESTLIFANIEDWEGTWPYDAKQRFLDLKYTSIFKGESKTLL